ncbi:hypothetical protein H6F71_24455 [Microcoleus sp. FACHB-61]|nr:hypothetical protein [Microcoleus sp. FACHB-61]
MRTRGLLGERKTDRYHRNYVPQPSVKCSPTEQLSGCKQPLQHHQYLSAVSSDRVVS